MMNEYRYVAVKASLHASVTSVFGLTEEEISAISKKNPASSKLPQPIQNGILLHGGPMEIMNYLSELGYKVVSSSGESEINWTLRRELLEQEKDQKRAKGRTSEGRSSVSNPSGRVPPVRKASSPGAQQAPLRPEPPPKNQPIAESSKPTPAAAVAKVKKEVVRIGTKPEELAEFTDKNGSKIYVRNLSSLDNIDPDQKIILRTNLSSEGNPLSLRNTKPSPAQYKSTNMQSYVKPAMLHNNSSVVLNVINPEFSMAQGTCGPHGCTGPATPSTYQTINEMDFERGIWNAAVQGDMKRLAELLAKGTHPDIEDASGYTALHYAARNGHVAICSKLLHAGANINAVTRAGRASPLHRAALAGHTGVLELLLKNGANPGMIDKDGRTALHRAVENGHKVAASLLLRAYPGAAGIADSSGRTPMALAAGNKTIEALFSKP